MNVLSLFDGMSCGQIALNRLAHEDIDGFNLAAIQASNNERVLLEANVPEAGDFQLYFRTATGDEIVTEKNYTLVTSENTLPKDANSNVYREYRYLIGGQGGDLAAFTKYQLKIVMQSTNQALIPKFQSLRAIALSV